MSLARIDSLAQLGLNAPRVHVEVHVSGGLPAFHIVGLPETAVKESRDRVRSAIINSGFEFPARRITVSLAPADLPKEGGRYDLPVALGILAATGQVASERLAESIFLGELALNGDLRAVRGALPAALAIRDSGRRLVIPEGAAAEAALVSGLEIACASSLLAVVADLFGQAPLPVVDTPAPGPAVTTADLADVAGQHQARRALEVAAAGGHSLLMVGPPGTGKSMLAARLPGILPAMSEDEALDAAAVQSIAGRFDPARWRQRPFRAPHHTASGVALVGGGSQPRPGEISLAHTGVLFLDELPEFDRKVLEVLREPLESGRIVISRAARQAEFPARFQLVAAMNPCPCGYHGDPQGECRCTIDQVRRYCDRVSGPLLDRIDLQVLVPRLKPRELSQQAKGERSAEVRARVEAARERQLARHGKTNAELSAADIRDSDRIQPAAIDLLDTAAERLGLSARAHHRILRVAMTITDLAARESVSPLEVGEAIAYRQLERR
ncbi:MAG: YifB family Mg chelatase-like AAA ATPase [Gammaproteobacteria bacterium]|nr:YifB family Mg chelatase-like AAA ATPase [Gammaproteobacteria bacterium]